MDIVKYTVNSSHGFPVMGYPPTFDFDADALGVLSDTPAAGNVPEILGVPYDQGLYSLYTCGYKSALSWLTGGTADTLGGRPVDQPWLNRMGSKNIGILFFQNYHLEKQV